MYVGQSASVYQLLFASLFKRTIPTLFDTLDGEAIIYIRSVIPQNLHTGNRFTRLRCALYEEPSSISEMKVRQ